MELILNVTNYDYSLFLSSKVDVLMIALEGFSSDHLKEYSLNNLPDIISNIHSNNKKIYLSLNIVANEDKLNELKNILPFIKELNLDGIVISDIGFFQLFKEIDLLDKIIFNPVTTITNKYAAKIANDLGINHVCIANELNFNDIMETAKYCNGNIEILAQGYYQICNSKRPLITNFLKKLKIKSNSSSYYIQEETRDYAYPIIEIRSDLLVYTDKQRSVFSYLKDLKNTNIQYYRIDTSFLKENDIYTIIEIYHSALKEDDYNEDYFIQLEKLNSNMKCLDNISILKKEAK